MTNSDSQQRICRCVALIRDDAGRLQCLTHGDVTDWQRKIDTRTHKTKPWGDDR